MAEIVACHLWEWVVKVTVASSQSHTSIFQSFSLHPSLCPSLPLFLSHLLWEKPWQTGLWRGLYRWCSWPLPPLLSEEKRLEGRRRKLPSSHLTLPWNLTSDNTLLTLPTLFLSWQMWAEWQGWFCFLLVTLQWPVWFQVLTILW